MKLKNIFIVALAAVTLFSCTTEITKYVPTEKEAGTARIKVGLAPDAISVRSAHSGAAPTADELKIYNYALFIFNSAGMLEASLIATPYTTSAVTPTPDDYNGPLTFDPNNNPNLDEEGVLTLAAGNKMFFAIVNAPYQLLAKQTQYLNDNTLNRQALSSETLTYDDLSLIVGSYNNDGDVVWFENDIDEVNGSGNRGFMMTTMGTAGYYEQYLNESENDDDITTIELTVGRAMAKVSLASDLGTTIDETQPNGLLDVESYKIINNPKEMYIMPNIVNGILTTPNYYDTSVDLTNYFDSHNSTNVVGLETNYVPVSVDEAGKRSFTYCIENANLTPKQGNATIAVIKGVFTPGGDQAAIYKSPLDRTSTGVGTLAKGQTFYRIWIPQYERTDTQELAGGRYDGNYYTEPISSQDLIDYVAAIETEMHWPRTITLVIDEFKNGVCYYRLPLENKENSISPYTVKRNSYYQIDIKSVMDAGYPGENENGGGNTVDPELPLEPQTHIKVEIKVSNWDEVPQEGNL